MAELIPGLIKTSGVRFSKKDSYAVWNGMDIISFFLAFQDQLAKSLSDFGSTFDRRLKCHAECSLSEGEEEKEKCEEANCNNFDKTEFKFNEKSEPFDPDYDLDADYYQFEAGK
jgi:hypothetical protein